MTVRVVAGWMEDMDEGDKKGDAKARDGDGGGGTVVWKW